MGERRRTHSVRVARPIRAVGLAICFVLGGAGASSAQSADELEAERLLVLLKQRYAPAVGLEQELEFPRTMEYEAALAGLVIAVGSDVALIVSLGHSEPLVQVLQASTAANILLAGVSTARAVAVTNERGVGRGARNLVETVATEAGIRGVEQFVGRSVPGLRSVLAVAAVYDAEKSQEQQVQAEVSRHIGLMLLAVGLSRDLDELIAAVQRVRDPARRLAYRRVMTRVLVKSAEVAVYRDLVVRAADSDGLAGGMLASILMSTESNISVRPVGPVVEQYLRATISRDGLEQTLAEIDASIGAQVPVGVRRPRLSESSQFAAQLDRLERIRQAVNRYSRLPDSPIQELAYQDFAGPSPSGGAPAVWGPAEDDGRKIAIIFDTSQSMEGQKLQDAKTATIEALSGMGPTDQVALVSFGAACSVELAVDFTNNHAVLVEVIRGFAAIGRTPLASALRFVQALTESASDPQESLSSTDVILVTDGVETCESHDSALEAARSLSSALGIDLSVPTSGEPVSGQTKSRF